MPYNVRMSQKNNGGVTFITPPSDVPNADGKCFAIINVIEEYKDMFAEKINNVFPNNNITVYPWERGRKDYGQLWLKRACDKSNFIIVDKKGTTEELDKLLDPKKTYVITNEITLENILEKIQKENFPN
jgi:hypothetical protein